jgi:mono/diheme cytochrome c family protein
MNVQVSWLAVLLGGAALTACGGHKFEPPDRGQQVQEAEAEYTSAVFDTVTWASDSVRELDGNSVYASKCRRCHGTMGEGTTDYARSRDLTVPSLVEPGWRYANSLDSVRERIWVGHAQGMPTFGIAGITPREIDGAAFYLLNGLRPDVLQGGGR